MALVTGPRLFLSLALAALLGDTAASRGADEPWLSAPLSADPAAVLSAAGQTLAHEKAEEGDGLRLLLEEERWSFDETGRRTIVSRTVTKVLRADAMEAVGTVEASYKPWKDEPPVLRARVVGPDGSVHVLDEKTIAERPASSDPDVFDDRRVRSAPLPGLSEGAVVERETVERESAAFPGGTSGGMSFGGFTPVRRQRLVVEVPEKLPFHVKTVGLETAPVVTRSGGVVTRTWEVVDPAVLDDAEGSTPPDVLQLPAVVFSTGTSWTDVSRLYAGIVEKKLEGDGVAAGLAPHGPFPTKLAEVDALLAFVQKEVRYTGLAFGDSAIVPSEPKAVRQRRYGDCKDQATLLVGLLRARGFDAAVALLRAGSPWDVRPELPALGGFDHAIVHVRGIGKEGLFVDPTSIFHRAGQVPQSDAGRWALVCRAGTKGLVRIPAGSASENRQTTRVEIRLADFGPGSFRETTEFGGALEAYYRNLYDGGDDAQRRKGFESYAKSGFGDAVLKSWSVSPPRDLTVPFRLVVEGEKATVAFTADTEAAFGVRRSSVLENLPEAGEKKRRHDRSVVPFRHEVEYRIVPPAGFVARDLPESGTSPLGPATLTTTATAEPDGSVRLLLAVELDRTRLTPDELVALREAAEPVEKEKPLLVSFEHRAEAALEKGRVKEAIALLREESRTSPGSADPHRRMSKVLLSIGLGEAARREAAEATRIEPSSARAFHQLGLVLQHDLFGRLRRKGWDPDGAEKALTKAVELSPDALEARMDRAILLEFDAAGLRYRDQARLERAFADYRAILEKRPDATEVARGYLIGLLQAGRTDEALTRLKERRDADELLALGVAARALKDGAEKSLAFLRREASDAARRRTVAEQVAATLFVLRRYEEAGPFFSEAARGGSRAAELGARADVCARLGRATRPVPKAGDPASVVKTFFWDLFEESRDADLLAAFVKSVRAIPGEEGKPKVLEEASDLRRGLLRDARSSGISPEVARDILASTPDVTVDGDRRSGWRVKASFLTFGTGAGTSVYWLVEEDGLPRMVATEDEPGGLLRYALDVLSRGDLEEAKRWLDRAREAVKAVPTEERPLWSPLLPRFWPAEGADVSKARLAATAGLADERLEPGAVEVLRAAWTARPEDPAATAALVRALVAQARIPRGKRVVRRPEVWEEVLRVLAPVRKADPDSEDWAATAMEALSRLGRNDEARALGEEHLSRKPSHLVVKSYVAQVLMRSGDREGAVKVADEIVAAPQASAGDYNNAAWFRMVAGKTDERTLGMSLKAVEGTRRRSAPGLNTLAAIYAELGRADEARALVLEGMDVSGADEPEGPDWYVVGRLLEGFGLVDDALAAYAKAVDPEEEASAADSITALARRRADALRAAAAPAGPGG